MLLNKAFTTVKSVNKTKLRDIHELLSSSSLVLRFFTRGKYEAVSDASRREVWNEFYAENNIISARLPANLFPRRLKFSRRWKNARPAALIMKACSKARFSREKVDLESVL